MRTIFILVRKDVANFLRNRPAVSLTFIVPIALIYIFGQVFGLNRKDAGPTGIKLAVVNESPGPGTQKLVDALAAESAFRVVTTRENPDHTIRPLTAEEVRQLIRQRELRWAVIIPRDVIPEDGIGLHLKILSDPRNEIETQMVNGLLQKTIFSNVPDLLGQSLQARAKRVLGAGRLGEFNDGIARAVAGAFGGDQAEIRRRIDAGDFGLGELPAPEAKPVDPTLRRLDAPAPAGATPSAAAAPAKKSAGADVFSRLVNLENEQVVGKDVKSPDATRVVGGWAIMFLLFAVSSSSAAFFDEKNTGIFQRLLAAPVSRAQVLWARFTFGTLLGLVQLVALFAAGSLMFGIDVLGHLGNLIIVCIAAGAACTSFGMLIAAVAPNAQAANGLATFVVMVMSATGGAWFPMSLMPEFMQQIGKFTVVYWSMEGFAQVLWAGNSLGELLPTLGVLGGITAGVMAISIWRLNRKKIFE
ncbi:MAG: ABC transporter permease [Opitutus sp.]|nr:ABC transporter permease [Opitutus sp.]